MNKQKGLVQGNKRLHVGTRSVRFVTLALLPPIRFFDFKNRIVLRVSTFNGDVFQIIFVHRW